MSDLVPLTGEPLALDLVNTRPRAADGPVDLLATPADLRAWLALQVDRLPEAAQETAELTAAELAAVHAVREHTAAAIACARRSERPPAAALDALNQAQRAAPAIQELIWDGTSIAAARRRAGSPGLRLAAW